jgi:hypothetical protein
MTWAGFAGRRGRDGFDEMGAPADNRADREGKNAGDEGEAGRRSR